MSSFLTFNVISSIFPRDQDELIPKKWPWNLPFQLLSDFSEHPCDLKRSRVLHPSRSPFLLFRAGRFNTLQRGQQFALGRLWRWASWLNGRRNLLQHTPLSPGFACLPSFLYWRCMVKNKKQLFFVHRLNLNAVWVFDVLMTVKSAMPTLENKPLWDLVRLLCTDGIKDQKKVKKKKKIQCEFVCLTTCKSTREYRR